MKLWMRLVGCRGKARLWPTLGLVFLLGLLSSASMAGTVDLEQAPPRPGTPRDAPLRPTVPHELHPGAGFIPPPMDLSHLTGDEILRDRSAHALPPSFDWRDQAKVTPVKSQGACSSCYAFAYLGSLESRLLIDGAGTYDLSENNAKECNGAELHNFEYPPGQGWGGCDPGNPQMLTGLFSQKGTVLESCDPYVASNVACRSDCAYQQTVLDWRLVSGESIPSPEALKQYLYDHGPIATGMYFNVQEFKDYDGSYTLNYAAPGDSIDHYVLLVGWSDNLPPEPGSSSPATGWIAKNSWGIDWGDAGYFYMTYGAAHIGMWSHFPHEWQAFDANEEVWFYDDFGWWSSRGCGIPTAWGLVRFIPDSDTSVTRVDFWTTDRTTDVDIYLYDSFDGTAPSSLLASKVNLTYAEAGYHSALLDSPLPVTSGNDVIAVIKFTNASHGYPVAQDKVGPIETGRTYFSCTGANGSWADLGVTNNSDVAIRLRTKRGAAPAPVVTGITPNNGTNDGVISIANLAGSSFQPGATVKLTKQGQTAINATAVTVLSASKITCQFDLTGKAPGAWDVIVTNPDTQSGSLPGGFAVKQAVIHSGEALLPLVVAEQPPVIPADATILQGYPASNYGHTSDMWTGFDHCETDGQVARSLLRFDLSAFGAGPPISRATLHIYLINSCDIGERSHQVTAYRVTSDWSETAVAWNNQPGFAEAYGSVSVPSRHWGWYSLDVTGLVRGWLDGSYPNRGLLLRSNESPGTDSARLGFSTRESPGTTKDPYIQIVRAGQAAAETVPALQRERSLPALCGPTIEGAVGIPRVLGTEAAPGFLRQSWCEAE